MSEATTPPPLPAKPAELREELVANAVQFLRNPNVAGTPLARRIAFMKRKGMTDAEVNAALRRADALGEAPATSVAAAAAPIAAPSLPAAPQNRQLSPGWGAVAAAAVLAAGVGVGAAYLVDAYVLPWWRRRKHTAPATVAAVAAAADEEEKETAGDDLKDALAGINQGQKELLRSLADLTQAIREQQQQQQQTKPSSE